MPSQNVPFDTSATPTTGPKGQLAHADQFAHNDKLAEQLYSIGDRAWTLVGNGLSNQSFVEGPEGIIAIDTGECIEEMQAALKQLRTKTDKPLVACIYTHFHYVAGTQAIIDEAGDIPIWGHSGIDANLARLGGEVGPRSSRGMVHQFGIAMPDEGPDGLVNVGLGRFFRNPDHAPYTHGYVPAAHTFSEPTEAVIAGLKVHLLPAPSDATDSITIWFPELGLAVNNLVWPALFNVFAIRGEEYRDPRILLGGLDELAALAPEYLLATHGPPMQGRADVVACINNYRDSIQFLWDQTVRGANLGLTHNELINFVTLPPAFSRHYTTQQYYGVVEHHVRQIYSGLFGWFDEDEARLFPVPAPERQQRLVSGFGGVEEVRRQIDTALADADFRWAIELASWLVRCEIGADGRADAGEAQDRERLATGLRGVAITSTSANIRNWCLTRALELDGSIDLGRFRGHRFRVADVLAQPIAQSANTLRVLLVPERAADVEKSLQLNVADASIALSIRNQVLRIESAGQSDLTATMNKTTWAKILGGKLLLANALDEGNVETSNPEQVIAFFACFDLATLKPPSS